MQAVVDAYLLSLFRSMGVRLESFDVGELEERAAQFELSS